MAVFGPIVVVLLFIVRDVICITMVHATVKFLNFGMPEIFAVIYLRFKQRGQTLRVFCQNGANRIANSEDPDQTAIWVCTVCPDLSVQKIRVIMVCMIDSKGN